MAASDYLEKIVETVLDTVTQFGNLCDFIANFAHGENKILQFLYAKYCESKFLSNIDREGLNAESLLLPFGENVVDSSPYTNNNKSSESTRNTKHHSTVSQNTANPSTQQKILNRHLKMYKLEDILKLFATQKERIESTNSNEVENSSPSGNNSQTELRAVETQQLEDVDPTQSLAGERVNDDYRKEEGRENQHAE